MSLTEPSDYGAELSGPSETKESPAGSPEETTSSRLGKESDSECNSFSLAHLLGSWCISGPQFLQIWDHYDSEGEYVLSPTLLLSVYGDT